MRNTQDSLKRFNYLSSQLYHAIDKRDHEAMADITREQKKLITNFSNSAVVATEDIKTSWDTALKEFKVLEQKLQADLKELNNNTRNNLRRLKGYSSK